MRFRTFACALCCAAIVTGLVAGCSEVNSQNETNLANVPLPKGVGDKSVTRPVVLNSKLSKELSRRSSPPMVRN